MLASVDKNYIHWFPIKKQPATLSLCAYQKWQIFQRDTPPCPTYIIPVSLSIATNFYREYFLFPGHGKLVMADGSFYEGEFINGEIEGHGFRKWASSGNTYSGQFCNGELNGCGVMTYGTGAVYEGEFQNNRKEGQGTVNVKILFQ